MDRPYATMYNQLVQQPMWLKEIRHKLTKRRYASETHRPAEPKVHDAASWGRFWTDVALIVQNCRIFNEGSPNAYQRWLGGPCVDQLAACVAAVKAAVQEGRRPEVGQFDPGPPPDS
jgi:hypothetical protein